MDKVKHRGVGKGGGGVTDGGTTMNTQLIGTRSVHGSQQKKGLCVRVDAELPAQMSTRCSSGADAHRPLIFERSVDTNARRRV